MKLTREEKAIQIVNMFREELDEASIKISKLRRETDALFNTWYATKTELNEFVQGQQAFEYHEGLKYASEDIINSHFKQRKRRVQSFSTPPGHQIQPPAC